MSNLDWLYLARTPYWEEKDLGKKYSILRGIKNKSAEYKGKYTWDEISKRLPEYPIKRLREIEAGIISRDKTPPIHVMRPLIKDLGMEDAEFLSSVKIKKGMVISADVKVEDATPSKEIKVTERSEKPKQEEKPKQGNPSIKDMKVVSHLSSPLIFVFEKGKIHVYEDDPTNAKLLSQKSAMWIGPADFPGNSIVPREFSLSGVAGL